MNSDKPTVALIWQNFGAYHIDHLRALSHRLHDRFRVVGIEIAGSSRSYAWGRQQDHRAFERITVFPHAAYEDLSPRARIVGLWRTVRRVAPCAILTPNGDRAEIVLLSLWARLTRRKIVALLDAKLDDRQRGVLHEAAKVPFYRLYNAAIVAGRPQAAYCRFLGFAEHRIHLGYYGVDLERLRAQSGAAPAPDGVPHGERDFCVVARLVAKKNLAVAIRAYALFRANNPKTTRKLVVCGGGVLEAETALARGFAGARRGGLRGFPARAGGGRPSVAKPSPLAAERRGAVGARRQRGGGVRPADLVLDQRGRARFARAHGA